MEHVKCLIIGSGPAGYTAAIYAGRANLQPVEYCGMQTGGQLTQTTIVENFPGYPEGVDANQMMMEIREQAERFGCDIRDGEVTAVFTVSGLKNVMVRHGSYISIYCNLRSVSVSQGQKVSARQTLGAVAPDASGKPNLHFQLRKESATLNPEQWLAR